MYRPEELEDSLEFPIQLSEEISDECQEKLGITDCTVQIIEERADEGMCTVKFKSAFEAQMAAKLMNGRLFAGLRVSATIYDGSFELPKRSKNATTAQTDETDENYRLEAFSKFIERGNDFSSSSESDEQENDSNDEVQDSDDDIINKQN
jgi:HIV Tat-specific factor 1